MARDFYKVSEGDGQVVYINRAYIVFAATADNGELSVYLDQSAAPRSPIIVNANQATQFWSWLLEDRK